jgi:hypothetical protein
MAPAFLKQRSVYDYFDFVRDWTGLVRHRGELSVVDHLQLGCIVVATKLAEGDCLRQGVVLLNRAAVLRVLVVERHVTSISALETLREGK